MGTIGGIEFAVPVWATATALVLVLVVAWVFGVVARWLLRRRARLDATTAMVLSILGTALGLYIAGLVDKHLRVWSVTTVVLGLISSVVAVGAYGLLAARLQRQSNTPVAQLLSDGESDRLEFKSTARVNLRSGEKDPRMEQVIVKTVSAFLNSDGGTLLIGVADDGTPFGLEPDFATLKVPDADRFELWLRDLLTTTLGQNTAAAVGIAVESVARPDGSGDVPVCRVTCSPSPRPVYLRAGKNAPPEFWVRAGNSTRQLSVDAAADYVMHRWPLGAGRAIAAQVRAAIRFSAG